MLQTLNLPQCLEVLKNNYIGHLAFISGKSPYVVPITYYHDAEEKCILSYSATGFKIDSMRNYDQVAFQVDDIQSVKHWSSVLVHGSFDELDGSTAKKYLRRFAEGVQGTIRRLEKEKPRFITDFSGVLQKEASPLCIEFLSQISAEDFEKKSKVKKMGAYWFLRVNANRFH